MNDFLENAELNEPLTKNKSESPINEYVSPGFVEKEGSQSYSIVKESSQINHFEADVTLDATQLLTEQLERSRLVEEFESMLMFEDIDDIPASLEEVEELLEKFDCTLKKHGLEQSFDDTSILSGNTLHVFCFNSCLMNEINF